MAGVLAHDGRRVFEYLRGAATPADELLPIHEAGLAATAGGDQKVPFRLRHLKLALPHLAAVLREAGVGFQTPLEQAGGLVFQIVQRARPGMILSKPRDPAVQFRAVIAENGRGNARLGGRPLQGFSYRKSKPDAQAKDSIHERPSLARQASMGRASSRRSP